MEIPGNGLNIGYVTDGELYSFENLYLQFSVELEISPSHHPPSILHELSHSGANAGTATRNPGTLLFNNNNRKVIFVFLYLNICYLNYMLVSRLTVHQQQYLYFREGLINGTGPHTG